MTRYGRWLFLGVAFAAGQIWGCVGNASSDSAELTSSEYDTFTCPNAHYIEPASAYTAIYSSVDWVQEGALLTLDEDNRGVTMDYVDDEGRAWVAYWR